MSTVLVKAEVKIKISKFHSNASHQQGSKNKIIIHQQRQKKRSHKTATTTTHEIIIFTPSIIC
jgi:hypothetical protein